MAIQSPSKTTCALISEQECSAPFQGALFYLHLGLSMKANCRTELSAETINFITTKVLVLSLLQPPQGFLWITPVDEISASSSLKHLVSAKGIFIPSLSPALGSISLTFYLVSEQTWIKPGCCWLLWLGLWTQPGDGGLSQQAHLWCFGAFGYLVIK